MPEPIALPRRPTHAPITHREEPGGAYRRSGGSDLHQDLVVASGESPDSTVADEFVPIAAHHPVHVTGPQAKELEGVDTRRSPVTVHLDRGRLGEEGHPVHALEQGLEVFAELMPALKLWGENVVNAGDKPGAAQTMKLANNILFAVSLIATSEAMTMANKGGIDQNAMLDVLNNSTGRNSATQDKFPRSVLPGTFDFGFSTGLSYKDISLCIDEAEALGVPMVVGSSVRQILAVTRAIYGDDSDFTSMCRVVESWAGAEVRG